MMAAGTPSEPGVDRSKGTALALGGRPERMTRPTQNVPVERDPELHAQRHQGPPGQLSGPSTSSPD